MNKLLKAYFAFLFAIILAFTVSVPFPVSASSSKQRKESVSIGIVGTSSTAMDGIAGDLLPWKMNDGAKTYYDYEIYETLFYYNADGTLTPDLASGYKVVDDTHWLVTLNPDITDSEGNAVTADDVLFSFRNTEKRVRWDGITDPDHITKVDDHTLLFEWLKPGITEKNLEFVFGRTAIFSEKAFGDDHSVGAAKFKTAPVGTGPYKVKSFIPNKMLVLTVNENYWNKNSSAPQAAQNVSEIIYHFYKTKADASQAFVNGEIAYTADASDQYASEMSAVPGTTVKTAAASVSYYLVMNASDSSPMKNINLRLAVNYAIDNNAVAAAVGADHAASKALGSSYYSDYSTSWETMAGNYIAEYNPDTSAAYLARSGYSGSALRLVYDQSDSLAVKQAESIQSQLAAAGINCTLQAGNVNFHSGSVSDDCIRTNNNYDLALTPVEAGDMIGEWNRILDDSQPTVLGFLPEEVRTKYQETAKGKMSINDFYSYLIQNCYFGSTVYATASTAIRADIFSSLYLREGQTILPGSCTYAGFSASASEPAAVVLDQGVLVKNDKTKISLAADEKTFSVRYDAKSYSGVKAYYFSAATREKTWIASSGSGLFTIPSSDDTTDGKVYCEPVRRTVTVSLQPYSANGKWAGANLQFVTVKDPAFDASGALTGFSSVQPAGSGTRSIQAKEGDYVYFICSMDPGFEVKVNMAPHQIVAFTAKNADNTDFISYAFFDNSFNAFSSSLSIKDRETSAVKASSEMAESYNGTYDSFVYETNPTADRSSASAYSLYYIRIGTDVSGWEERKAVKANNIDTMRDLTLGIGGIQSDVEVSLNNTTLRKDTAVTLINTDNNNRDNMGNIEYKGYSTEDHVAGTSGKMYTNWYGTTFAGSRNGGLTYTPSGWTAAGSGAAQFRSGEGIALSVSDPADYAGISVYYTDDSGKQISVPVTSDPYSMYQPDGKTQYTPAAAPGVWYFKCPFVSLRTADHLKLTVEFLPKQ